MRSVNGTLEVAGELDLASSEELARVLDGVLDSAVGDPTVLLTDLHLDLRQVSLVDTAGLHALVSAKRTAAASGRHLRISTSEAVRRTIERAGLRDLLLG